ncbi:MAG: hypothetical protein ACLQT6_08880, partial [Desulfomonilaceae bacterium]
YHGSDSISVNVTETVSNHLTAASVVSVNVTGDQAPVLAGPSTISTSEGSAPVTLATTSQYNQADVGQTTIVETPLAAPVTTGIQNQSFVLSTADADLNVSGMASSFDSRFKSKVIAGDVTHTWTTSPNDPWQAGVNFGGSSSKTAEELYTDFENVQSDVAKGAVLRVGHADVITLSEVTQATNVYSDDSAKTLSSIVGDQRIAFNQEILLSLQPTPGEFGHKGGTQIAQATPINPDGTSFEDIIGITGDRPYSQTARTETESTGEMSMGLIDPEKISFQDLNSSESVGQNTFGRADSDEIIPDRIAGTIDLEKASFEDIV